jgi:signal transduction histidine kinase
MVLKTLRRRFILITMSLVGLVLIAVLAINVYSSFRTQQVQISTALHLAIERGPDDSFGPWVGSRPAENRGLLGSESQSSSSAGGSQSASGLSGRWQGDGGGGGAAGAAASDLFNNTPVFVITYSPLSGTVIANNNGVEMDTGLLNEAVAAVANASDDSGLLANLGLFYERGVAIDPALGTIRIAFANATPLFENTFNQALVSAGVGVVALLAFLGIATLLSRIALRPVERAWEQQRRFVADASHELKTPLTVILANANIMASAPQTTIAEQGQWLESTQIEAQRMDALIRDLLVLARSDEEQTRHEAAGGGGKVGSGQWGVDSGGGIGGGGEARGALPLSDLSAIVNRALLQFDAVFYERGIAVEATVSPGVSVHGTSEQLDRLISVLLDNAGKYSPRGGTVRVTLAVASGEWRVTSDADGGGAATVATVGGAVATVGSGEAAGAATAAGSGGAAVATVGGAVRGGAAVLTVANSGEPIPAEKLAHIFERFYRGDVAHSDAVAGFGLGLSIAESIVCALGGSIQASSDAEHGTVFSVRLPYNLFPNRP